MPAAKNWLIGKDPDAGKDWGQEEKKATEDEMVGWHDWLNGHEFEQTPGDSEGQGSLAFYSPWGHRVWHDLVAKQSWIYVCFQATPKQSTKIGYNFIDDGKAKCLMIQKISEYYGQNSTLRNRHVGSSPCLFTD